MGQVQEVALETSEAACGLADEGGRAEIRYMWHTNLSEAACVWVCTSRRTHMLVLENGHQRRRNSQGRLPGGRDSDTQVASLRCVPWRPFTGQWRVGVAWELAYCPSTSCASPPLTPAHSSSPWEPDHTLAYELRMTSQKESSVLLLFSHSQLCLGLASAGPRGWSLSAHTHHSSALEDVHFVAAWDPGLLHGA